MANIKSQIKRNRQNDAAHERNMSVKSALKSAVRRFREAADAGDAEQAKTLAAVAQADADVKGAASDAAYALERMVLKVATARGSR